MENKKTLEGTALRNYQEVVRYLDVIVLARQTIDLLKTNADFQTLVLKDITIVKQYEEEYEVTNTNLMRFSNAFSSITGKPFVVQSGINIHDELETSDTINYNPIFIKNITHLNFDEIAESLGTKNEKVEVEETTNEAAQAAIKEGVVSPDASANFHAHAANNGGEYGPGVYNRLSNEATEQFINQSAAMVLQYNVAKGTVYIFKDKPKIIPVLKWLTMIFYFFVFVLNIVGLVFSNLASAAVIRIADNNQPITWGQMSQGVFQILEMVMISLVIGMSIWSLIKTFKNENQKYSYSWVWTLFFVIFLLIFGFLTLGLSGTIGWSSIVNNIKQYNTTPEQIKAFGYLQSCVYVNYALLGILCGMIVIIIVAAICNPKRDFERIQKLLISYADQIRSGEIDPNQFSNGGGFFNRMGF